MSDRRGRVATSHRHRRRGLYRLLDHPRLYRLFQVMLAAETPFTTHRITYATTGLELLVCVAMRRLR